MKDLDLDLNDRLLIEQGKNEAIEALKQNKTLIFKDEIDLVSFGWNLICESDMNIVNTDNYSFRDAL